uniref:Uncharacterized protein n=1 Tax=Anopheles culicifacies TaxID=139723 RepID=A0A182M3M2_9DIPT
MERSKKNKKNSLEPQPQTTLGTTLSSSVQARQCRIDHYENRLNIDPGSGELTVDRWTEQPTPQTTNSFGTTTELTDKGRDTSSEATTSTTTTEYPHNAIAKVYAQPTYRMSSMQFASGKHRFLVGPGEDENQRALEEYYNVFVRAEKNLPPITPRSRFAPQRYD